MEQIVLNWEGPFKFNDRIPSHLIAAVGLYLLENNSRIFYVGKAEEQGGFRRAKDHLRGYMDSAGRCVLEKANVENKDEINIWIGWIEEEKLAPLIGDAENLLIHDLNPPCNKTDLGRYNGRPLRIVSKGDYPKGLTPEIQSTRSQSCLRGSIIHSELSKHNGNNLVVLYSNRRNSHHECLCEVES